MAGVSTKYGSELATTAGSGPCSEIHERCLHLWDAHSATPTPTARGTTLNAFQQPATPTRHNGPGQQPKARQPLRWMVSEIGRMKLVVVCSSVQNCSRALSRFGCCGPSDFETHPNGFLTAPNCSVEVCHNHKQICDTQTICRRGVRSNRIPIRNLDNHELPLCCVCFPHWTTWCSVDGPPTSTPSDSLSTPCVSLIPTAGSYCETQSSGSVRRFAPTHAPML